MVIYYIDLYIYIYYITEILPYLKVGYILMCLGQKVVLSEGNRGCYFNIYAFFWSIRVYYSVLPCLVNLV